MKKICFFLVFIGFMFMGSAREARAGETSLAGYLTYWDGTDTRGKGIGGTGGGIKLRKHLLGIFSADIRGGYIDFDDIDTTVIPVEATIMVGIPLLLEPYVGVGAGYYAIDSDLKYDNGFGTYGLIGVQFNLFVVGAMAEVRYNTTNISLNNEDLMDGLSANVGLMLKW